VLEAEDDGMAVAAQQAVAGAQGAGILMQHTSKLAFNHVVPALRLTTVMCCLLVLLPPPGLPQPTIGWWGPIHNLGPMLGLSAVVMLVDLLESTSIARALAR
jgi:hypothetical protein